MRMAGPDVVLFVVGALLFSGATAAIVTREGGVGALGAGGSALGVYNVAYATRTIEGESADVPSWASATAEFTVNNTRVTRLLLAIECADPVPAGAAPYTLRIEVAAPNNITVDPIDVGCSTTEIPIEVTPVPSLTTVRGRTEEEARANLPEDANATLAVGIWTFTVTGSRTPPAIPIAPPAAIPANGQMTLNAEAWEPSFTPVQR